MRATFLCACIATGLCAVGCGEDQQLLFAEVEVEELCDTRGDVAFELTGPPVPLAFTDELEFELPEEIPSDAFEAELQVVRVRVKTSPASGDLSFVEQASIFLRPNPETEAVEALRYQRQDTADAYEVRTQAGPRIDLLPFVKARTAQARLELSGTIPSSPFVAEVETCLYLRARYGW